MPRKKGKKRAASSIKQKAARPKRPAPTATMPAVAAQDARTARNDALEAIEAEFGPTSILGKVDLPDTELRHIAREIERFHGTYDRPSDERIHAIVSDVVSRHHKEVLSSLNPRGLALLDQLLFNLALGIVGSAVYDVLKLHLAHWWAMFMAEEPTPEMISAGRFAHEVSSAAPADLQMFVADNMRAIWNLRAKTWRSLEEAINDSELKGVVDRAALMFLANELEQRVLGRPTA
jgi:hypothetical protein